MTFFVSENNGLTSIIDLVDHKRLLPKTVNQREIFEKNGFRKKIEVVIVVGYQLCFDLVIEVCTRQRCEHSETGEA